MPGGGGNGEAGADGHAGGGFGGGFSFGGGGNVCPNLNIHENNNKYSFLNSWRQSWRRSRWKVNILKSLIPTIKSDQNIKVFKVLTTKSTTMTQINQKCIMRNSLIEEHLMLNWINNFLKFSNYSLLKFQSLHPVNFWKK